MGNVGYRYVNSAWFAETIGTVAYVDTTIGNAILQGTGINWADGTSLRAAGGERVGTTFVYGPQTIEASLLARVWNEFEGNNSATLFTSGPPLLLTDGSLRNRPFGEVSGMIDLLNTGSGWSAFISGGTWFNNEFTTVWGKIGARYQW